MSQGLEVDPLHRLQLRYQAVREELEAEIERGRRAVGSRLPPERTLAEHFGVSRVTLRRALDELVRDGVIEKMFIEPEKEGDPFEVSDADTMLKYVAPQAVAPEPVTIFTKPGCPFCAKARALLDEAGLSYEEITLGRGITSNTLQAVAGAGTAPQVFSGGKKIGGSEDLQAWLQASRPDAERRQFLS
jgi:glutaredoxin-like protein